MNLRVAVFTCLTFLLVALPGRAETFVTMNTSEAEAVLSILEKRASGLEITGADWSTLFTSEPYVRLHAREASMQRDFSDAEFRDFVLSGELAARASELGRALDAWLHLDLAGPLGKASAYLPEGTIIAAKIYPVIKPKTNSFVFEISTDPAIFLYLDPAVAPDKLSNTLAHELHHIGFGTRCPTAVTEKAVDALPENAAWLLPRLGAFGEGYAMLAAAGGPEVHPHAVSAPKDRERWDRDVAHVADDLRKVEGFILGTVDGSLSGDERQQAFFSFYGEQGPWYTVGWVMASTIEHELGRDALLDAFCDTRRLLPAYNRAARAHNEAGGSPLPLWSDAVIAALAVEEVPGE